ncbi:MAG: hypothetical protein IPL32_02750 [Chloracidobacterium sp.]|nr:hypothetical protein [Chloracidobacterium sp.]
MKQVRDHFISRVFSLVIGLAIGLVFFGTVSAFTAMPTETPFISGTVSYGTGPVQPKFITNATVIAVCSDGSVTSTVTDANGQYVLTGMGTAPCTISVAKESGQNGIASADAARIAQHNAGTFTLTTNTQKIAADTSGNGIISSQDAAFITRFVASFAPPIGRTHIWKFFLPNPTFPIGSSPTTREYSCACTLTNQDFIGILIGEVTGNWTNTGARPENSINTTALLSLSVIGTID